MILLVSVNYAYSEVVCSIYDGDTFRLCSGQAIRIWGIDSPELRQPTGPAARDYLSRMVMGRDVQLKCVDKSYKRLVCQVQQNGLDVEKEMVGWGWAYDSAKYSHGAYAQAEAFARNQGRGVWVDPAGGERPWVFRHQRKTVNLPLP